MDQFLAQAPTTHYGIPSYANPPNETDEVLKVTADAIEQDGIATAQTVLANVPNGNRILTALRSTGDVAWRYLLKTPLEGPYLDATAEFGVRAHILSESGQPVCALDSNLHKLRIAAARDDFETEGDVFTVHGSVNDVPVPQDEFRTVIADDCVRDVFTDQGGLRTAVERLKQTLTADGTLVLKLDGWPCRTGLTTHFWANDNSSTSPGSIRGILSQLIRSNAASYRSLLTKAGFMDISLYALLPSRRNTQFAFAVDDRPAIEKFISEYVHSSHIRRLIGITDELGLLNQVYPSYLVVCSLTDSSSDGGRSRQGKGTLLRPGYNRSIAFDLVDGVLEQVRKFPNADSRATTTQNEAEVLQTLQSRSPVHESIVETLPNGHLESTPHGLTRKEAPVSGVQLVDHLNEDPRSLYRTLSMAFSWLASFQTEFRGNTISRPPKKVFADLDAPGPEIAPSTPNDPIELFRSPVHGDLHLWNIYVANERVSTVIDWEFAAVDGFPTTDVGILLQYAWTNVLGSYERGFEAVVSEDTPYAEAVQRAIKEYCHITGLAPRALRWYLTHGPARALRFAADNPELHTPWTTKFIKWTDHVREHDAAVQSFFNSIVTKI